MTLAVLLSSTGAAASLTHSEGESLAEHLRDQLRRAGADEIVTADLAGVAELARTARRPLLLCSDDVVAHTAVLRHLASSPAGSAVALVLPRPRAGGAAAPAADSGADAPAAVLEDRGQIVAVGDLPGKPTGTFGGALRVGVDDLPALAAAAEGAAADPAGRTPAVDRLLVELTHTGATITAHRVRLLVARRVADQAGLAAAEAAVAAVDSDSAELRLSVKEKDDFFTTYFVSTWSPYVTRLAARFGVSPTQVTAISALFAVGAAVLFGVGGRPALVGGAILLYLGFVLDCVDGQLARYTRRFSSWGGWLDTVADRAKEYIVYAGLAIGVERAGLGNGWTLAIAAMVLQTVRHTTDAWYGALHDEAVRRPKPARGTTGGLGDRLSRASVRVQADTGSLSYWLKRTVVFPIGERWALIALTVALFNPLVSLLAVLGWGSLAAIYTLGLRAVRARSMRVPVLTTVDTQTQRHDGMLARWLGRWGTRLSALPGPLPLALFAVAVAMAVIAADRIGADTRWVLPVAALLMLAAALPSAARHAGSLDWLVPAALRAAEYLFVIAVWRAAGLPAPLTFALLFVLALHHYDLTARLEKKVGLRPGHRLALGWDERLVLLALVGCLPYTYATVTAAILCVYLLLGFILTAVTGWAAAPRRGHDAPGGTRAAGARVLAQRSGGSAAAASTAKSGAEDRADDPDQLRRTSAPGAGLST